MVGAIPGTNVTLCCEASGSPRPNVEWFQAQKSSVSFPVFQEDGCLQIKMVKEDVDFICRAKKQLRIGRDNNDGDCRSIRRYYLLLFLQGFENM